MNSDDREKVLRRFWAKVNKTDGCWLWTGTLSIGGYGQFRLRTNAYAHRVSYQIAKGEIQPGMTIDHLCRVRHCVNPAHLEVVTPRENTLRGMAPSAISARRDCCANGHEYTQETLFVKDGHRACRVCERRRDAMRYQVHVAHRANPGNCKRCARDRLSAAARTALGAERAT